MNKRHSQLRLLLGLLLVTLLVSGCLSSTSSAPVVNAWLQPRAKKGTYLVNRGDTVYSIAWAFGLDYRALAKANGLRPPYHLRAGQRLRMSVKPRSSQQYAAKSQSAEVKGRHGQVVRVYTSRRPKAPSQSTWSNRPAPAWRWPARGRIIQGFSPDLAGNRGIDIAGRFGEPVHAAASGEVVYSGDGVRGYGNLLIIKHNDSYLSAYAFNRKLLVKLGQRVRAGQVIAEMGRNNAGRVMLHFEIRRNGKPQNPERYLHS
ncbi:MAG: peptidoglycan DD-metalloendopeptidase family protein [Coxiellaceae bacterium]|nr:peptidoglycan DD-metalloendopeptidase family protein [Coxiellaceae bacterium]